MESESRLPMLAAAWKEALELADAHRDRLRAAVLQEIAGGMTLTDAARLAGVSRVTVYDWTRAVEQP